MSVRFLVFLGLCCIGATLSAATAAPDWQRVTIAPMKTSLYVASVRLTTSDFARTADTFTATYEAKVVPWFFWSERGDITMRVSAADLARLASGERIMFTGVAKNHRNKPREVTGYAEPSSTDGTSGRIKVRIHADGVTLVFDGSYRADSAFEQSNQVTPP